VGDYNDILTPFEFHDNRLQANHNVTIALSATVAVVVLVIIPGFEVFWILFLDFLISKSIAYTRVKLIESFPFELIVAVGGRRKEAGSLNSTFECRRPYCQLAIIADRLRNEFREFPGIELTALRDIRITSYLPLKIEF
jgi:hypothetical protein